MEKLIFRKFFKDTFYFFIIGTLSLSLIVWVIQAVNYLDFVSEDGHSFRVYFLYTLLTFPKIISRLMIFMFFISIFYTLSRYEEKNELIIFWTNGIKKKDFLNFIIKFSFVLVIIHIILNVFVVPKTQDLARSYIRSSNIDYFPSLIKSKKFVSTVEDLTIFIDKKKDNGELENIFIKDTKNKSNPQIISAKNGILKKDKNYFLILFDGNIIDQNQGGVNIISYDKTLINLSNYSTKSTVAPKIQEQSSKLLFECIISIYKLNLEFINRNLNCNPESAKVVLQELYKRLIIPFYLIIVAIIGSSLTLYSESGNNFTRNKIIIFLFGIAFIVLSQVLSQFSLTLNYKNIFIIILPFIMSLIIYLFLHNKLTK